MSFVPLNPRPMLSSLVGGDVRIKLKWGQEYTGTLVSTDSYMNIQLSSAEEWEGERMTGTLGQVLIRCNNVLWISHKDGKKANEDTTMSG